MLVEKVVYDNHLLWSLSLSKEYVSANAIFTVQVECLEDAAKTIYRLRNNVWWRGAGNKAIERVVVDDAAGRGSSDVDTAMEDGGKGGSSASSGRDSPPPVAPLQARALHQIFSETADEEDAIIKKV